MKMRMSMREGEWVRNREQPLDLCMCVWWVCGAGFSGLAFYTAVAAELPPPHPASWAWEAECGYVPFSLQLTQRKGSHHSAFLSTTLLNHIGTNCHLWSACNLFLPGGGLQKSMHSTELRFHSWNVIKFWWQNSTFVGISLPRFLSLVPLTLFLIRLLF